MILSLHYNKRVNGATSFRYELAGWQMLAIISISMEELRICTLCDNNSLLSFYSNSESCLIIVSGIFFCNIKGFPSIFIVFKPSLELINIMRSSSFICKRLRSLNHKMRMTLKKCCRPVLSHSRRRIRGVLRMFLGKNPICTILKLPMTQFSSIFFLTFNYMNKS